MTDLDRHLSRVLDDLRTRKLHRRLRKVSGNGTVKLHCDGQRSLAFAANDYLGLSSHPFVRDAAKAALDEFGTGSGSSRLITGSLPPHRQLEEELARFKGTEAALSFGSGYLAAVGTITSLLTEQDTIVSDRLNHACLIDGARLSGAEIIVFQHNDLDHLDAILQSLTEQKPGKSRRSGKILILTESVFSMDGDQAPLAEMAVLKNYYGVWLMVDEAHATGLFGNHRRGLAEQHGVADQIDIQLGTLSKALGTSGGFVCGSRSLIEYLINRARSFIFTTAPPPAVAGAALAALEIVQSKEGERRVRSLWDRVEELRQGLGLPKPDTSPIVPYMLGEEARALDFSARLQQAGLLVPAIRYPSVPSGQARLRITLSADHTTAQVNRLTEAIDRLEQELVPPHRAP